MLKRLGYVLKKIFFLDKNEEVAQPQREPQNAGARRRALAARNARARQRNVEVQEDDEEQDDQAPVIDLPEGKIGAKKMAKLQAKAERKAQREAEDRIRQEKKKAQELAEEERKKQEAIEKERELKKEEEERKAREEKERKEHEEYLKLKEAFSVQEEGYEEGEEESENLLQEFVNYIKNNKVVVLEDIAVQFKLKTQQAIDRIQQLQADGLLTGVIDDRGKFIYISEEELDAVAKFVKQRGRVSIIELVENSNNLINLSPINAVSS